MLREEELQRHDQQTPSWQQRYAEALGHGEWRFEVVNATGALCLVGDECSGHQQVTTVKAGRTGGDSEDNGVSFT